MTARLGTAMRSRRSALLAVLLLAEAARALPVTTAEIVAETLHPATLASCLKWTYPIGLCIWLTCGPFGCVVRTSLIVGHYNPDLVVTGYHRVGETPWVEMAALYGTTQKAAGQALLASLTSTFIGEGNRPDETFARDHRDLRFKESDAIGHPAAALSRFLGNVYPLLCPSEAAAFAPYLLSTPDLLAWRFALPEMVFPEALLPGVREIGTWPLNTWQAVYPRHGFTTQAEDPKAGAVVAQRAGDVVTRVGQPHVYLPTVATRPAPGNLHVFWPPPLRENDRKTGIWQMLTPLKPKACEVFGQNDTTGPSWADWKSDDSGDYGWTLWRPYECCRRAGQILIGVIRWVDWPP